MTSTAWKSFERDVARLLGGRRFWANSGGRLDVEAAGFVAQCKLVKQLSLEALTRLVEEAEREGAARGKAGVVAVKVRRGGGRPSPVLLVLTARVLGVVRRPPLAVRQEPVECPGGSRQCVLARFHTSSDGRAKVLLQRSH